MTSTPFSQRRKFIINLGKALHKFGTPAYRLEAHLLNVSSILGMGGSFIVTPTSLTFALWQLGEHDQQQLYVVRVKPGDLDLGSLARTDELVDEVANGDRTLDEAIDRLEDIQNKPEPYSHPVSFAAFGVSGGAFAMLMATSWNDVIWSFVMSLVVYLFVKLNDTAQPLTVGLTASNKLRDFSIGTGLGAVTMLLGFGSLLLLGEIQIENISIDAIELVCSTVGFLAVAYSEELIFRGFLMRKLQLKYTATTALVVSSIIFAIVHLGLYAKSMGQGLFIQRWSTIKM